MSQFGTERTQDDPIEDTTLVGDETPGEYEPTEQTGGESLDTGVVYDSTGEPEKTPNDVEIAVEVAEAEEETV
ncbi:MAG TPA: hypothetical protein VFG63_07465 [Nocardioidaceae bacterium]|nr:hypothetical protein [Nocardioidaceae bacterium]